MNYHFDESLAEQYHSKSQKVRVMSENWVGHNLFCPCCGNPHIKKLKNNIPVSDLICDTCGEFFELKSKKGRFGAKIVDGAYDTMLERITSNCNPELLVMQYSPSFEVTDLVLIPKFFFVPDIIEKRKPLSQTARRAGWVGCSILYSHVPNQGKIRIIQNQTIRNVSEVMEQYQKIKQLQTTNIESRGWLIDVLNCINRIEKVDFSLLDIYAFVAELSVKHPRNNNIEAKIRQQLQILRDKGIIEFAERGHYRKLV